MAGAFGRDSFGVILSGTETDGAAGIQTIKEAGGFTLVQEPEEAEFPEMPSAAIETGQVDLVLPASRICRKISAIHGYGRHLETVGPSPVTIIDKDAESLREILTLVRLRTGHDFGSYKRPTILRRITRRIQVHDLADMAAYARFLRSEQDEIHNLLKDLLISVTNYFRDTDSFLFLKNQVIPRLFEGKTERDCVRVWSCGCSTGEEPYSLAMLLMEYAEQLPNPPKIQIFASDINYDAVKCGREGCYKPTIASSIPPELLKRFFRERSNGMLQVTKELREAVLFAPHNVLHDPPFSRLDLVVCRNLLIYLKRETQKRVMELFSFSLNPGAFLFLGSSEGAEGGENLFTTFDKKNRIYQNSHPMKRALVQPVHGVIPWDTKRPDTPLKSHEGSLMENHHFRLISRYAPASVLITASHEIIHMCGPVGDFLRMPAGLPTRDVVKSVHPSLQLDLRAVLMAAIHDKKEAKVQSLFSEPEKESRAVTLLVRPAEIPGSDYFLVVFEETVPTRESLDRPASASISRDDALEGVVRRLEEELQETRERLHLTMEQSDVTAEELKASNEELQAINEELRSATEELETSREELQSVNEELATVNLELKEKVEEISSSHSDLQNLMHSSDIGTVFLTRDLRIKRYTRRVEQLINIIESDIGRPFDHLTYKFDCADLRNDAATVLETLQTIQRQLVVPSTGNAYLARLSPYRTMEEKIEGVVISFVDITELRRTAGLGDPS